MSMSNEIVFVKSFESQNQQVAAPTPLTDHHEKAIAVQTVSSCFNSIIIHDSRDGTDDGTTNIGKAIVFVFGLAYLLFGISIITDRIVGAMGVIAAHKRTKTVRLKNGTTRLIKTPVWNSTVLSLTVFTVGTSAPEIFLPTIEVFYHNYTLHDVGPSLIVGSGAFHFFFIVGVCMAAGNDTFSKPIKDKWNFAAQTVMAMLAYIWIYLVVQEISPGRIELWEALATLAFYPLMVVLMWIISKRYPQQLLNSCRNSSRRKEHDVEMKLGEAADQLQDGDERRRLASLLHELRASHPEKSGAELEEMLEIQIMREKPKDAAFYRFANATFPSKGQTSLLKKPSFSTSKTNRSAKVALKPLKDSFANNHLPSTSEHSKLLQTVGFTSNFQTCSEDCGEVTVHLFRKGAEVDTSTLTVAYETVQGKALAHRHYIPIEGRLVFEAGQREAELTVTIVDDAVFQNHRKEFRIRLTKPELGSSAGPDIRPKIDRGEVTISVLEDDHCGVFAFEKPDLAVPDDCGEVDIKVLRLVGVKGRVFVPFKVNPGNAVPEEDYLVLNYEDQLIFEAGDSEQSIKVRIVDKDRIGAMKTFFIELDEPKLDKRASRYEFEKIVKPSLGENRLLQVGICENEELKEALDRLVRNTDLSEFLISESWLDQLRVVFQVPADPQDKWYFRAKCWILYVLSFPWRFLTALLPPPRLFHGWAAYLSLLGLVAFFSILILDCASHLGCNAKIPGIATGLVITAFGLGLPDVFACRYATIREKTADAAIGHITGSNSGCVFLGIGLAWSVAAIYQQVYDGVLAVYNSDLAFIVTIYCFLTAIAVAVLLLKRLPPLRGELGGPPGVKIVSSLAFFALWVIFVVLSVLKAENVIKNEDVAFLRRHT